MIRIHLESNPGHKGRPGQRGGSAKRDENISNDEGYTLNIGPNEEIFHGTMSDSLYSILNDGLLVEHGGFYTTGNSTGKLYLTQNEDLAIQVAAVASVMHDEGRFAVLTVELPSNAKPELDKNAAHGFTINQNITPDKIGSIRKYQVSKLVLDGYRKYIMKNTEKFPRNEEWVKHTNALYSAIERARMINFLNDWFSPIGEAVQGQSSYSFVIGVPAINRVELFTK